MNNTNQTTALNNSPNEPTTTNQTTSNEKATNEKSSNETTTKKVNKRQASKKTFTWSSFKQQVLLFTKRHFLKVFTFSSVIIISSFYRLISYLFKPKLKVVLDKGILQQLKTLNETNHQLLLKQQEVILSTQQQLATNLKGEIKSSLLNFQQKALLAQLKTYLSTLFSKYPLFIISVIIFIIVSFFFYRLVKKKKRQLKQFV